jgi:photosystem II stability/assembly factor-like uncharacterized protein
MKCKIFLSLITLFIFLGSTAQEIQLLDSGYKASFRGLSVVSDEIVWVSGSNGTVGRSMNGGKDWKWITVKGFEKKDFRDIEAFSSTKAILLCIESPGHILLTEDGGENWKTVYTDTAKKVFFDAMSFYDDQHGVLIGDPLEDKPYLLFTEDGGYTWNKPSSYAGLIFVPQVSEGESFFAASGTNIIYLNKHNFICVTGGKKSRFFYNGDMYDLPLNQGKESTGANSIARWENRIPQKVRMMIAGGDFSAENTRDGNFLYSHDGGNTWKVPAIAPFGYRSCATFIDENRAITCGTSGVDYSTDGGNTWKNISKIGFHVAQKAKKGSIVFLAGGRGRIAKLSGQ